MQKEIGLFFTITLSPVGFVAAAKKVFGADVTPV
jgi:hypothetical protein